MWHLDETNTQAHPRMMQHLSSLLLSSSISHNHATSSLSIHELSWGNPCYVLVVMPGAYLKQISSLFCFLSVRMSMTARPLLDCSVAVKESESEDNFS